MPRDEELRLQGQRAPSYSPNFLLGLCNHTMLVILWASVFPLSQSLLPALTKHHRLSGLRTTEMYLSQFWWLEVRGQSGHMLQFYVWHGPASWFINNLTGNFTWRRSEGAFLSLFYKGTNPIHDGSSLIS